MIEDWTKEKKEKEMDVWVYFNLISVLLFRGNKFTFCIIFSDQILSNTC